MHNADILGRLTQQLELPFSNPVLVFSLILLIILLAPIIMGKFKIPGIVGFIMAGIAVGPHGLNLLTKNSAVELFSTIGLLYIMFIARKRADKSPEMLPEIDQGFFVNDVFCCTYVFMDSSSHIITVRGR